MKYNFKLDIEDGERGEKIIVNELKSFGYTFVSFNKDNKYDALLLNKKNEEVKFEIKTDVWCIPEKEIHTPFGIVKESRDSGNLFIEFECRGKDSGIKVTKAKYFVTYFPYLQEAWFILTNKLKKLINDNELPTTTDAGDEKSGTKGYLINRELYKEHFKILNVNHKWEN